MIELPRQAGLARSYDYVVVGAGSAGCVVARRLLDGTDATVLLLEAGGSDEGVKSISNPPQWPENIGSPYDWAYRYEPSPHVAQRSIPLPLGKVLGGSGSINAMYWARGNRADYDAWAETGNAGWDFNSVLPLFKQSEDWEGGASEFRGAGGPIRVERARDLNPAAAALIDAGKSSGMPYLDDVNVPEPEGVGPMNLNVKGGTRCSPSRAYLRPVMERKNLTVLTEAQAVKLTLSGTRCTGLDFLLDGQLRSVRASREVLLCAGAIHTPRLLLLSGIGPPQDLAQLGIATVVDLSGVGRNLQDHPLAAGLCFEAKVPLPTAHNNLGGSTFFWKSRSALGRPDLMFLSVQFPFVSHEIGAQYPIPPNAFAIVPALVRPRSRGYLRLKTAEPNGPLEIQANFLAEQADIDALVAGIELGFDIASQPAFRDLIKRWVAPPKRMSQEDTVAFVRQSCSTYFHPVGTCAMGSGREAVVDAELRVRGIEGLRIADASVMPTIPSANTHAAVVMIGEFASQLLVAG
ncbi:MAG TPA: GMC family oxidoreductase N-terminal domain-containing protein [Gemmataceae bacterium]|nr:GMC family oxidoreductase N-terminal domain-containing protein [Gemmataceae bacterium]